MIMNRKSNKLLVITLVCTLLMPNMAFAVGHTNNPQVTINGETVNFTKYGTEPVIKNDRVLIPVKAVFEDMGAVVSFNEKTKEITIQRGADSIVMSYGSLLAVIIKEGKRSVIQMDLAPVVINGRALVPMKYIGEALDSHIEWHSNDYTAVIVDAQTFYQSFKENPSDQFLQKMDQISSTLPDDYKNKMKSMRTKMGTDYKEDFLRIEYELKIANCIVNGDKVALAALESQIYATAIKSEDKEKLKISIKNGIEHLDKNMDSIALDLLAHAEATLTIEDYNRAKIAIDNVSAEVKLLYKDYVANKNTEKYKAKFKTETALLTRLSEVYKKIEHRTQLKEAEIKIENYLAMPNRTNFDIAKAAVNALSPSKEKTQLQSKIKSLESAFYEKEAELFVLTAEQTKQISDYLIAEEKVSDLYWGSFRTSLFARLDAIKATVYKQLTLEATAAVTNVERLPEQASYDYAVKLVDLMTRSTEKTALINRLDAIEIWVEVDTLVKKAETSKKLTDIDAALKVVNKLAPSDKKTAYLNRLDALKVFIESNALSIAEQLVKTAEATLRPSDYKAALEAIKNVTQPDKKAELTARLKTLYPKLINEDEANALSLVEKAEKSKLQSDLDIARIAVNKLGTGDLKTTLTNRLNTLQQVING